MIYIGWALDLDQPKLQAKKSRCPGKNSGNRSYSGRVLSPDDLTAQLGGHMRHARAVGLGGVQVALGDVFGRAGGADLGHDTGV